MKQKSLTAALLGTMRVLKRYIHYKENSSYLILGLFVLLTHCFKNFDAVPYILITGPYSSGKTLSLDILNKLCYRALLASQISKAAFYHVIHRLRGTLIIDEAENLARRHQSEFDMGVLLHGYKNGGFVVRVDPRKRRHIKFDCFGPKVLANTGGIYNKQLKSRCIVIKTVPADHEMERFLISRDGRPLKELASGIASLFKRKRIKEQIRSAYYDFKSIEGLSGRDLELWIGMLVIAHLIDLESPGLKIFDRVAKVAVKKVEKRDEDSFFLHWDTQFLLATEKFVSIHCHDSNSFIKAEELTNHVIREVQPPFNLRTEGLGRKLDKESLLIERKLIWFKDERGNLEHKTGWRIDVGRLKRRNAKYQKYIQPIEDLPYEPVDLTDVGNPYLKKK